MLHDVSLLDGNMRWRARSRCGSIIRSASTEWLLLAYESPKASGGRGLARGSIFARDGRLVVSTAREGRSGAVAALMPQDGGWCFAAPVLEKNHRAIMMHSRPTRTARFTRCDRIGLRGTLVGAMAFDPRGAARAAGIVQTALRR
jgi:hypothetical protein